MKEYYFLNGKDQKGPLTIDQLSSKELTSETLIWTEGMENWTKLKDIPELAQTIKLKSVPPPIPTEIDEKTSTPTLKAISPSKTVLTWLIAWCGFHLLALLMSYSQIKIFNDRGTPQTDEFWPFVNFTHDVKSEKFKRLIREQKSYSPSDYGMYDKEFNGIFTEYDWTEFAFYVGSAIVILLILQISNKSNKSDI